MGTRNLTVIIKDNKIRLSQYGQWDGYFDYTGIRFLDFVKGHLQGTKKEYTDGLISDFASKVDLLKATTKAYLDEILSIGEKYCTSEGNKKYVIPFSVMFPQFSRDTGIKILDLINSLRAFEFGNQKFPVSLDYDKDGWCEYANVINLDTKEIYMLTCHEFKGKELDTCELVRDTYAMKCFYKSSIVDLPSIKEIKKQVKALGL